MVRILLIEDGLEDQAVLTNLLELWRVSVCAVCLAEEAVHRLQMGETFDGIICDVAKANMTGLEFMEWLRVNRYNKLPLLLHSRDIWSSTFDLQCFAHTPNQQIIFRQKASVHDGASAASYGYLRGFVDTVIAQHAKKTAA